ncbi:hypothetical protein [Streptococcus plurextorum]|uniref:hypothetical protein n=1 Tax=Streptococcus plurextorum TaxID=456876 RepID=UPI0003F52E29|nr:hypothetical protein [Streptococcus plurextorum]
MTTQTELVKATYTTKKGREVVITGKHVYNAVSVLSLIMLLYIGFVWWQRGQLLLDGVLLLGPIASLIGGIVNGVKWLCNTARK